MLFKIHVNHYLIQPVMHGAATCCAYYKVVKEISLTQSASAFSIAPYADQVIICKSFIYNIKFILMPHSSIHG